MQKSEARSFGEHLISLLGPQDSIRMASAPQPGIAPICCFFFHDRPREGLSVAVTYGLSLAGPEMPELIVCVNNIDESWGLAAGAMAEHFRGESSFAQGTLLFGPEPLSAGTEFSGFLLGEQRILPSADAMVQLPDRRVRLLGAYPVHECEKLVIERIGGAAFLARDGLDPFNVDREHIWE